MIAKINGCHNSKQQIFVFLPGLSLYLHFDATYNSHID